jgi:transcriptional regulator of acetoin/glycerol metabolism
MAQPPLSPSLASHAPRVLVDSAHAQHIASSHERCLAFGLSREGAPDLRRLSPGGLQELQQRNARLCAQALPVMDMLYEQLMHAQSMVLLTDASGTVLHALGDPGFLDRASQVALAPGALWAEADKGTNAVGTALMTETTTLVHGQEHFLRAMQFLTCSAAPIFDHKGALLGVIDVSGERRSYHPHTLALASMSARLIEGQWFADRFRHSTRLHFHSSAMGLGTLHEGQLALDEDGRVLGANRRALDLLGLTAMALRRENLGSLFGCSLGQLVQGGVELRLPQQRGGEPLHAKLSLSQADLGQQRRESRQEIMTMDAEPLMPMPAAVPLPAQTPPAASQGSGSNSNGAGISHNLRRTEMQAIAAAVQAAAGNLSEAARQLGIGRSTLYRKLKERV